jgi:heat shock protein HslJ
MNRPAMTLVLAACASGGGGSGQWVELETEAGSDAPVMQLRGTVRHLGLEGGVFVIRDDAGTQYNPTNLPQSFRVDGKAVEAEARRRDDMASIGMVGPMVELIRIRERAGGDTASAGATTAGLAGTKWRLEDLAGKGVVEGAQATLEFTSDSAVSGNGSCNRFHGPVTLSGGTISFGALAATRMFCGEAATRQETEYFAALDGAERWEITEPFLYIYLAARPQPLRFVRQ